MRKRKIAISRLLRRRGFTSRERLVFISVRLFTLAMAAVIGTVSGFYGGWIDESLMGVSELFLSLPWLYFLLGIRAFLPLHVSPVGTFLLLIGVIGAIGWARPARLVRGVV